MSFNYGFIPINLKVQSIKPKEDSQAKKLEPVKIDHRDEQKNYDDKLNHRDEKINYDDDKLDKLDDYNKNINPWKITANKIWKKQ